MVKYRTEYMQRKVQQRSPRRAVPARPASPRLRLTLLQLVQRYPLGLLLIAWLAAVVTAAMAAIELVTVDSSELPAPVVQPAPVSAEAVPLTSAALPSSSSAPAIEESQSLPFVTWAVVALGCAIGCTLISRGLKPYQPIKRMEFASSARHPARRSSNSSGPKSDSKSSAESAASSADQPAVPVAATVLPHDQSYPLDWDEPSLADSLDLRQRRPLSYWLRS